MYRCEATSVEAFIQQLAVSYVTHGYWFYVTGHVPEGKDCHAVDRKLIASYGIDISKWARSRLKRGGVASVQYLRHRRFFVLIATHGVHPFFVHERGVIRDVRRAPLRYGGYSVSYRGGHPHVRIEKEQYTRLKSILAGMALERDSSYLRRGLTRIPFEPYAPVRRQMLNLLRGVNRRRREAGMDLIPFDVLRFRRRIQRVFAVTERPVRS
jgi:hypothetical protein